ncbi:GNAT family N-acetyltransferase [Frankia sp. AiPs1]|uniref:GNAT family N-acetyltransferase n=1 Tax=Frankia sp. AiPs1 TaxID=573493 RepID=UPI002044911B|nr:GNAT family protein [Frankia sp. AiPs1]MCM3922547.1 GNAT family N-acetyltransferase [Frankia sp. AiPs1]
MTLLYPLHLAGAAVTLREFGEDDTEAVHALVGDSRVTDYLSFDAKTREQSDTMLAGIVDRARQEPRTEFYLAVDLAGSLIGFARLGLNGVQAAKLGYAIQADQWGRGHATDAVRTAIQFGFGVLGLHRISAAIGPNNAASVAVVEHLGFTVEGRIRDHVYTGGIWRDSLLYSVLTHEWPTSSPGR